MENRERGWKGRTGAIVFPSCYYKASSLGYTMRRDNPSLFFHEFHLRLPLSSFLSSSAFFSFSFIFFLARLCMRVEKRREIRVEEEEIASREFGEERGKRTRIIERKWSGAKE